ncbi:CPBP family intramembrane metalloprotease [Pseudoclavibacter sp. AY1F1]|uniref:CPBP family intramembrane glutamic endopeptidase n=1 Tax=Pseudoclavibacter sp. AY1F1 TaxID=2080583 RepID=UPI000CE767D8|nr:type II CAAX endopeptidase family protein [Pseudoclavibacter sp. AY1F1]PPF46899.1 CPBP family intramembrane metalloprotease [Pseudoclavibacter sp. AY1F1]
MSDATTTPITPNATVGSARPGWTEMLTGGAFYVIAVGIVSVTLPLIPDDQQVVSGIVGLAVSGLIGLAAFAAAVGIRIRRFSVFGLRRTSWKWIIAGAGAGIACYIVGAILSAFYIMATGDQQNIQSGYQAAAAGGVLAYVATILLGSILTPLGEELYFRGVVANALGRYDAWVSVLGSATIFALAHGINPVLPVAFVVGIATALLFHKTGSVWPGVAAHALNNAAASTVPVVVAGLMT